MKKKKLSEIIFVYTIGRVPNFFGAPKKTTITGWNCTNYFTFPEHSHEEEKIVRNSFCLHNRGSQIFLGPQKDNLTRRKPHWKTILQEDDRTGRQLDKHAGRQIKSTGPELGPAQPQLVILFVIFFVKIHLQYIPAAIRTLFCPLHAQIFPFLCSALQYPVVRSFYSTLSSLNSSGQIINV